MGGQGTSSLNAGTSPVLRACLQLLEADGAGGQAGLCTSQQPGITGAEPGSELCSSPPCLRGVLLYPAVPLSCLILMSEEEAGLTEVFRSDSTENRNQPKHTGS